jgi:hypothetical protein
MMKFPRKRLLLIVLAVCLALAALSAEVFVLTHIDHDCEGEECPVCAQIEIAQNALKALGLACIAAALAVFIPDADLFVKQARRFFTGLATPITLHVKSTT